MSLFEGYSSSVLTNARFRADVSLWKALDTETWHEGQRAARGQEGRAPVAAPPITPCQP